MNSDIEPLKKDQKRALQGIVSRNQLTQREFRARPEGKTRAMNHSYAGEN